MFLIVAATDMEMRAFTNACNIETPYEPLISGVGPMETAHRLTSRLAGGQAGLQGVIHFGIAGAYIYPDGGGAGMLDICLAKEEILGDFGICHREQIESFIAPELEIQDRFSLDNRLLTLAVECFENHKQTYTKGNFVTVNCASATRQRGDMLIRKFQGLCENMEGAAVARVCTAFNLPCLELRCISNFVEDRDGGNWELKKACRRAGEVAALLTEHLDGE